MREYNAFCYAIIKCLVWRLFWQAGFFVDLVGFKIVVFETE